MRFWLISLSILTLLLSGCFFLLKVILDNPEQYDASIQQIFQDVQSNVEIQIPEADNSAAWQQYYEDLQAEEESWIENQ